MRSRAKTKKLRRSITLALIIALPILCIMLLNTSNTKGDKQAIFGSLTENLEDENKVLISTLDELVAFRDAVNAGTDYTGKEVILVADIDCEGFDDEGNIINKWVPIGNGTGDTAKPFTGIFNGNGFTISNICLAEDAYGRAGLFGLTEGTIKNLKVEIDQIWDVNNFITNDMIPNTVDNRYVGSIAAENNGTITNSVVNEANGTNKGIELKSVTSAISGGDEIYQDEKFTIGGLVGKTTGTIKYCVNNAKIFAKDLGINGGLGGIAGENNKGKISNCTNNGDLKSTYRVGGIVGWVTDKDAEEFGIIGNAIVENCLNKANINYYEGDADEKSTGFNRTDGRYYSEESRWKAVDTVGGIVGKLNNSTVNLCENKGKIYGYDTVGGIVGNIGNGLDAEKKNGKITSSINNGEVYGVSGVRRYFG